MDTPSQGKQKIMPISASTKHGERIKVEIMQIKILIKNPLQTRCCPLNPTGTHLSEANFENRLQLIFMRRNNP